MTALATTKIECPNGGRHAVSLLRDGSVRCDCADGVDAGTAYAARLSLGAEPIPHARGCGVLVSLVMGADAILPRMRSLVDPGYLGPWADAVNAYRCNPVFVAALARSEQEQPERKQIDAALMSAVERAGYRHALGQRKFRKTFRTLWDVPVASMQRFPVASTDDDVWTVPYAPGWQQHELVDGRVVCGVSPEDKSVVYAIVPNEEFEGMHWILAHRLSRRGKLTPLPS